MNGQTVAVRTIQGETDTLNWILTDHLNSTAVTAAEDGSKLAELRYSAFGEIRFSSGVTPTEYQYTGQLNAEAGLIFYNARFYDPSISHFVQSDSFVPYPDDSKSYDRYSYTRYNPVRYIDPSGHCDFEDGPGSCGRKSNAKVTKTKSGGANTSNNSKEDRKEKELDPNISVVINNNSSGWDVNPDDESTILQDFVKLLTTDKEFWDASQHVIKALEDTINYGRPIYKQVRSFGSISSVGEGVIGGLLQLGEDVTTPGRTLSVNQVITRALIIGIEDGLVDVASDTAGKLLGTASAGAVATVTGPGALIGAGTGYAIGYFAGNVVTTRLWDSFSSEINNTHFGEYFP